MQAVETYSAERNFSAVVASIYRAAGSPTLWRPVLEHLTGEFGAFGAQINVYDPVKGAVMLSISYGCEWLTPARLRRYLELAPTDPRVPYAMAHPGMPNHCRQAVSEAVLHASQMYKEILGPGDCEYSMVAQTPVGDKAFFIGVLRHRDQKAYTHEDVGRFSLFMPHIRRSVGLGLTLSQLDYSQQVASAAFEALPVGVALVSADLRVLYANGRAKGLIARVSERPDILAIPQAHSRIAASVGAAAEAVANGQPSAAIAPLDLLCRAGRPLRIHVTGIDDERARPLLGTLDRNCAMVVLEEGDAVVETLEERLERMFGLTAAEIRTAKGVADGLNPKVLAREIGGISPETIRTQLKVVFRKTHTASQAELAQLLGNLPVWPSMPPPMLEENGIPNEM